MSDTVGFTIPGYEIERLIGQGAFARVYLAHQPQYARRVAIKVLDFDLSDARLKSQFERECAATGGLAGHPNILSVLDAGLTSAGTPYITSAFCEEGTLADRVTRTGPLPVTDVLRIGVKLAGALDTAHRVGIVHRDVKPENVLLSSFGEPMLADWGIATITSRLATRVTVAAMTPNHAAPEVLESKPASPASDIYALGSTLYSLLAGRPPFQMDRGANILSLIVKVTSEPVPPIPRTDIPPGLFEAIQRAMAKDPDERWPSAAAFGHALQQVQYQLGLPYTELVTRTGSTADVPIEAVARAFAPAPAPAPPPTAPGTTVFPSRATHRDADGEARATVAPGGLVDPTVVRPGTAAATGPAHPVAPPPVAPGAPPDPGAERPAIVDGSATVLHGRHAPVIERPAVPDEPARRSRSRAAIVVVVVLVALVGGAAVAVLRFGTGGGTSTTAGTLTPIQGGQGVGSGGAGGTAPAAGGSPSSTVSSTPTSSPSGSGSAGTGDPGGAAPPRALDVTRTDAGFQLQWADDNGGRYPFIYELVSKDGKRVGKASFTQAGMHTAVITEADTGPLDASAVYCGAVGTISSSAKPLWADARCTDGTTVRVS